MLINISFVANSHEYEVKDIVNQDEVDIYTRVKEVY